MGTGLAGLSAAIFLVRDAQMPGENIHILEVSPVAGGALDGAYIEGHGYCCRGGRELEAHMECLRFAHHTSDIGGAGAFSDMLFIKYNQYESFVPPILSCLEYHGVKVTYNTTVTDIRFDCKDGKKTATQITTLRDGKEGPIALTENDFIFTTLGSNVENSTIGSHHTAPKLKLENGAGKSWPCGRRSPLSPTISAIPTSSAARCRRACSPLPRWILATPSRPKWRRSASAPWAAAGPAPAALSLCRIPPGSSATASTVSPTSRASPTAIMSAGWMP